MKESARARLMVLVRRTLNKYGYPPDKQQKAIDTVSQTGRNPGGLLGGTNSIDPITDREAPSNIV